MNPARVLHVIDSLHLGGAQEVILNIVKGANRSRFQHEVATMHGQGVYWDRLEKEGIPLHSLSPQKLIPLYVPRLAALLHRERFDILHCHLVAANILGKPIGKWCGVPVRINHDHTNDPSRGEHSWLLALETWANRASSHVVAVSESCRDFLISREHIQPSDVSLIRNAIDLSRFSPSSVDRDSARADFGIPLDVPLVVGVGRLNPQKNFLLFLEIAALVRKASPRARFLIAGTGPEEYELRAKAASMGIADSVVFAGYVADARRVYAAADILLMPSQFEGLPMTLLESMAMKTPVVASRLDGMAEVIEDGRDGFLVAPGNAVGFSDRVLSLIHDPEEATSIGSEARKKVEREFSSSRMVAEIEAVYERLLP